MSAIFKRALLVLVSWSFMVAPAAAADLDLNVNDDAARLTYGWDATESQMRFDAGWLHHQDRGNVGHLGLHLVDLASTGSNPLRGGVGGKVFYLDSDRRDDSGFAVGLGGFLAYTLPRFNRLTVSGHVYFAPDVLAFSGAEGYQEFEARLSYNVLRQADIYLGARYSEADFGNRGDALIDNGLHVGIQLRF
ncbi:MAG: YfaZ family outer membrane protein [Gammaproteobacteria bacterium]|jgi:hypothetical protein